MIFISFICRGLFDEIRVNEDPLSIVMIVRYLVTKYRNECLFSVSN